jgi:hypothetical protein
MFLASAATAADDPYPLESADTSGMQTTWNGGVALK